MSPMHQRLMRQFKEVRERSLLLAANLSDADATVQSMDDTSPAKWHLAHTTWFFETFILRDHVASYNLFNQDFPFLFNSYYEAEGARHARPERGLLTRPCLDEVRTYRRHVDAAINAALQNLPSECLELLELGLHHEQQHQELLLTDILHLFSRNPLGPAFYKTDTTLAQTLDEPLNLNWMPNDGGIAEIGHDGKDFSFDCEGPRHEVLLHPHAIANRCVTNREWQQFIADGGYKNPQHWLSDGWAWLKNNNVSAPLYWRQRNGNIEQFTLSGWQPLQSHESVRHISLYEADAYASWAGARLPTEAEWEVAAANGLTETGNVWEWTGSAYRPYPGFIPAPGAVGEYNGKFMSGQFVLKGSSVATSPGHMRNSYRNFFYPHQRWQFTGLRLAKDI